MKAVKGYRYLYLRGDQLYFRRRLPLSANAAFNGREEGQRALGTSNIAEAWHLLVIEGATFDKMIADATGKPVADAVRQIVPSKQPPHGRNGRVAVARDASANSRGPLRRVKIGSQSTDSTERRPAPAVHEDAAGAIRLLMQGRTYIDIYQKLTAAPRVYFLPATAR